MACIGVDYAKTPIASEMREGRCRYDDKDWHRPRFSDSEEDQEQQEQEVED